MHDLGLDPGLGKIIIKDFIATLTKLDKSCINVKPPDTIKYTIAM